MISPPVRFRHKPIALIEPGHRVMRMHTEDGTVEAHGDRQCAELLQAHEDHTLYTEGAVVRMRYTTGAKAWEADTWKGRATAMRLIGTKVRVISLRGLLDGPPPRERFGELLRAVEWLRGYGVTPSSLSQMGWALWRGTLHEPIDVWSEAKPSRAALYGGRQEVPYRDPDNLFEYKNMVQYDLQAAYPTSMANRSFALTLRKVSADTEIDPMGPGLAEATVVVPTDMPFAPLPVRVGPDMIQWQHGYVHGVWPWCELAAAVELGCDAIMHAVWAPGREADLFGPWLSVIQEGRALGGGAGKLAKALGNTTWGVFGMKGDQAAMVRWRDDAGEESYTVALSKRRLPHVQTAHLAAEASGRVRTRLLVEALYGGLPRPVHIDTDGVIVRGSSFMPGGGKGLDEVSGRPGELGAEVPTGGRGSPLPGGDELGEWRRKTVMRRCDVRAPQVYRFTCAGCDVDHARWHYKVSGVSPSMAPHVFDRIGRKGLRASVRDVDMVLAPGHAQETGQLERNISEAVVARSMSFGEELGTVDV